MEPWPTNMPERRSPPGLGFARGKRSFPAAFVCFSPIATRGDPTCKRPKKTSRSSLREKSAPPEVVERALFGLARCQESLPAKNAAPSTINDPAIKTYERLLKEFPDTVYKQLAESRIAVLRTGTAQDFNAWFETQNPKPADRAMPKDLSIPPLPEDFGPSGKTSGKDGSAAPANGVKKDQTSKGQRRAGSEKNPAPDNASRKAAGAAPAKPSAKPTQNGPAMPNPSAPASK